MVESLRKCEVFGCDHKSTQQFQIAPGTNVWLCWCCAKRDGWVISEEVESTCRT